MAKRASALIDTRVIYCGDNLDKLPRFLDACVDLVYIDPPFNSNRNYEVFWGETKEKRSFEDRHATTQAYIEFMRPRCVELARVLKPTGSFYYHCDWHASHYVRVMLDQIFGENNFQSEIIWRRTIAKGLAFTGFPNNHDTIFYTACRVMAKRLRDVCGLKEGQQAWLAGQGFIVEDLPWSEEKLRKLPPFEFENWAVAALGGIPNKAQVGDMGIDGRITSSLPR